MAQPGREFVTEELQVSDISQVAGVTTPIIIHGVNMQYDAPRSKSGQDLISYQDAVSLLSSGAATQIPFIAGASTPIVITNWQAAYAPTYSNGKFTVQYKIATAPDQIQEVQIYPIRTKDVATNTLQDTVSFDFGAAIFYDGQIIIEYSNVPLP